MNSIPYRRGWASGFLCAGVLLCMALLAQHAGDLAYILRERTMACLRVLIPSLFGCTALAVLLRGAGGGAWLGWRLRLLARLLGLNAQCCGIFVIAQLAGYPVGAMLLRRAEDEGSVTRADAVRLSAVCFGGGPAFLVGLAGTQLLGSAAAGWCIMGACVTANLLLALLTRRPCTDPGQPPPPCVFSAQLLTDSVTQTMHTMAQICGMVLLSGVVYGLCSALPVLDLLAAAGAHIGIPGLTTRALFAALLDITQLETVFRCGLPWRVLVPLTAGLLSFGGVCVHFQCLAAGTRGLSLWRLLGMRLLAACITAALTAAMLPLLPLPETCLVFAEGAALSRSGSPLPGLLILLTGFPLVCRREKIISVSNKKGLDK